MNDLSRAVSHALRHDPQTYGIMLDNQGWTTIEALVKSLRTHGWPQLEPHDIEIMVAQASNRRHEIAGNLIRAVYGHSTGQRISRCPAKPPEFLYHGTSRAAAAEILRSGLRPMSRHYVHLSSTVENALLVGERKETPATLLIISATDASDGGVNFYLGSQTVWLADFVPPDFIRRWTPEG